MSPNSEVRSRMQAIGAAVESVLPPKWGFVVLAFPLDDREGNLNYVSNAW